MPDAGEKLLQLLQEGSSGVAAEAVVAAGKLDVSRSGDLTRDEPAAFDRHERIVAGVRDERRTADRAQDCADVDRRVQPRKVGQAAGARTEAFPTAPPLLDPRVARAARKQHRQSNARTPRRRRDGDDLVIHLRSQPPGVVRCDRPARDASEEDQRAGSLGISRREERRHCGTLRGAPDRRAL